MSQRGFLLFLVISISFTSSARAADKAQQDDRFDPNKAVERLDVPPEFAGRIVRRRADADESVQH